MNSFQELLKLGITVQQNSFMCNELRHFDRKNETFGSSGCPVTHSLSSGARVEGRVNLDRVKVLRIKRKVIGGSQALRIERAFPTCRSEGGSP